MLFPFFTASRRDFALFNGRERAEEMRITAVGGGSLGSQVILNAARAGFGHWTTIDDDLLLPHNLARHGLFGDAVGFAKARVIQIVANALCEDTPVHKGIEADVLDPGANAIEVAEALSEADAIVDLSASVTVARALARDIPAVARRVSLFLNPSGTDLTLLAEDSVRAFPLDVLEMQYYRGLLRTSALENALQEPSSRIRYGRSCRDVSVALSHARTAVHGGIGAKALEDTLTSTDAAIRVWRADDVTLGVRAFELEVSPPRTCESASWTLVTDEWLLRRLTQLRLAKLPNETGGVLIGALDLTRRIAYIVDTIPSPNDSHEYPTSYLRGSAGLDADARRIEGITMGQLHYIGEWHSHPKGSSCLPSSDDANLFDWLGEMVEGDGLPPFIMIVGDDVAVPFFGDMIRDGSYPAVFQLSDS
ncbi:MAG: ThiF family adenylyltransferase [Gemmatimonadaceae bacterium]